MFCIVVYVIIVVIFIISPLTFYMTQYATKGKTYDERIAEQKKQLAMEHSMKAKSKHQQTKKTSKKVDKEHSHSEKKNKVVSSQNTHNKEAKKIDTSKNNVMPNTDKVDGNITTAPKKKNDKVHSKSANSNTNKTVSDEDGEQRINNKNDDNNDSDAVIDVKANSTNTSSGIVTSSTNNEPSSHNDNLNNIGSCNNNKSGGGYVEKNISKEKSITSSSVSENNDTRKGKPNLSNAHEKTQLKKQNTKQDGEVTGKSLYKGDEKNSREVKTHAKQKSEEKVSSTLPTGKTDEEKLPKDSKPLVSPSKSKKLSENVANAKTSEGVYVDNSTRNNSVQEEPKSEPRLKKESEIEVVVTEEIFVGNEVFCSVGRPGSVAARKQNNPINTVSASKTSLLQGVKNQRQVNNHRATKKQTTEIKTLQKINSESSPVNVTLLISLIANADLSRSEIQNLIDLLLNKQQENGTVDAEWIGSGRQDPVVKLKKQLAEKEKALAFEQEAHQAIQNKLKELRAELNIEKHANRQKEETLQSRQMDLQALNGRLQAITDEKQNLVKQVQQLQAKLNEERLIIRSLKEENSKTKSSLQKELLSQRQQLEIHIAHLNDQHSQGILQMETQLAQIATRLQEQEAANAQLSDENVILRERIALQESQLAHYQQSHTATQELMIQLEELRRINTTLERDLNNSQFEVTSVANELKSATEQISRQNAEIEKFNRIIRNERIEIDELLKENARLNDQNNFTFNEKNQLQIENEKLKKQLAELEEQSRNSGQIDQLEKEIKNYKNVVEENNQEIAQLKEHVTQLEALIEQYQSRNVELEDRCKVVDELKENLKKQLEKNNDLRSKNWKAMEALSNMEKTLGTKMKGMPFASHEVKMKEREEVLKRVKLVLPILSDVSLNSPTSLEDDVWFDYLEKIFKELRREKQLEHQPQFKSQNKEDTVPKDGNVLVLDELEKQNRQLQTMVSHYKSIISDTEGMLSSLQKHVEQEENRWSEQVQILQAQLNALTEEKNHLHLNKAGVMNGCIENDDSSKKEQKLNNCPNGCLPLLSNSSINNMHISS